ncbi:MAG: DnaJ domain-containing protein [Lautropia sp.]
MASVHTHYDNLRVPRNAPAAAIRAAYKALSQRYHPDRNAGDPEAERVMALVNASYQVLSDPLQRSAHDAWIVAVEFEAACRTRAAAARPPTRSRRAAALAALIGHGFVTAVASCLAAIATLAVAVGAITAIARYLAPEADLPNPPSAAGMPPLRGDTADRS